MHLFLSRLLFEYLPCTFDSNRALGTSVLSPKQRQRRCRSSPGSEASLQHRRAVRGAACGRRGVVPRHTVCGARISASGAHRTARVVRTAVRRTPDVHTARGTKAWNKCAVVHRCRIGAEEEMEDYQVRRSRRACGIAKKGKEAGKEEKERRKVTEDRTTTKGGVTDVVENSVVNSG